jgi:hypothetical protein
MMAIFSMSGGALAADHYLAPGRGAIVAPSEHARKAASMTPSTPQLLAVPGSKARATPNHVVQSIAECPSGYTIVSGGYRSVGPSAHVFLSSALGTRAWRAGLTNGPEANAEVQADAYCAPAGQASTLSAGLAVTVTVCVPMHGSNAILAPAHGGCRKGYRTLTLGVEGKQGRPGGEGKAGADGRPGAEGRAGAEGKTGREGPTGAEGKPGPEGKEGTSGLTSIELETLKSILPLIRYVGAGVGGKPTIQFTGANVQIVNGEGSTPIVNGEGNLVIGYAENAGKHAQDGSHNLVLGEEQTFTSYGGILGGAKNTLTAPFATVSSGEENTASATGASVGGGFKNLAGASFASVFGGKELNAPNEYEAIP